MPSIRIMGWLLFFWSNEFEATGMLEPIHIHCTKGKPHKNAPKWWIGPLGQIIQCSHIEELKANEINEVEGIIRDNWMLIVEMWHDHFKQENVHFHEMFAQKG